MKSLRTLTGWCASVAVVASCLVLLPGLPSADGGSRPPGDRIATLLGDGQWAGAVAAEKLDRLLKLSAPAPLGARSREVIEELRKELKADLAPADVTRVYAEVMSRAELAVVLKFIGSDAGKKFAIARRKLAEQSRAIQQRAKDRVSSEYYRRLRVDVTGGKR